MGARGSRHTRRADGGRARFDDLPDEILVDIFWRLDCLDVYSTLTRVSKRWRAIASDRKIMGPASCFAATCAPSAYARGDKKCASIYAHAPTCPRYRLACADAILAGGGPKTLRGLKALGHKYNESAVMASVIANDIPCLDILHASACRIATAHYEAAARLNRVDVLEWLFAKEGANYWNSKVGIVAARHGHIDCLRLAHVSGVKWDKEVAMAAARNGHVECLAYARDYGCPWDASALYAEAKSRGRKACCKYILQHSTRKQRASMICERLLS